MLPLSQAVSRIPLPFQKDRFKYDMQKDRYESVRGINCTIGLPIVRTSVDHGTAFGKAGEGRANEESMMDAIFAGVEMAGNSICGNKEK